MTNNTTAEVSEAIELLNAATHEQIERANDAVFANLDDMGLPKYDSAFGYACALTAIIQSDLAMQSERLKGDGEVVLAGLREVEAEMGALLSVPGYNRVKDAIVYLEGLSPPSDGVSR